MADYGGEAYKQFKGMLAPMKQDWHPDHNMPDSEHNGTVIYKSPQVNRVAKSDMEPKGVIGEGSDRYGGADLPTGREGSNEMDFRKYRD